MQLDDLYTGPVQRIRKTLCVHYDPDNQRVADHEMFKKVVEEAQRTTGADYLHITHKKSPEKHAIDFEITPYYKK